MHRTHYMEQSKAFSFETKVSFCTRVGLFHKCTESRTRTHRRFNGFCVAIRTPNRIYTSPSHAYHVEMFTFIVTRNLSYQLPITFTQVNVKINVCLITTLNCNKYLLSCQCHIVECNYIRAQKYYVNLCV